MEGSLSVRLEKIELRAFMQELDTMAESLCQTCKHTLTPVSYTHLFQVRPERQFSSLQELTAQIARDQQTVLHRLTGV